LRLAYDTTVTRPGDSFRIAATNSLNVKMPSSADDPRNTVSYSNLEKTNHGSARLYSILPRRRSVPQADAVQVDARGLLSISQWLRPKIAAVERR
jgi:hypothetical protein